METYILGIESSCDDTSASVLYNGKILSNITWDQQVHEKFGGVFPELASRQHQLAIVPVVLEALSVAGIDKKRLSAVAFTRGPGLIGSLLVGTSFAKGFAMALDIPIIEVNHMKAHVLAHFIEEPRPAFPFLCMTVSGGHTQILKVKDYLDMEVIGQTLDDAAGEAFDKSAKLLGLKYPGGPVIDRYAQQGNSNAFDFPEPQVAGLDFSFSGLKTSILYFIQKKIKEDPDFVQNNIYDLCASIQRRIVTILIKKLTKAAKETGISEIAIAGGVSANRQLRKEIQQTGEKQGWNVYIPRFEFCTDNAAMIAINGYYKYLQNDFAGEDISPLARYKVKTIQP